MSATPRQEHDWAVDRLVAYGAGTLPEEALLRIEQHLQACDECRALLAPLRASAAADLEHLPASWIATWPRASRALSGLERRLVETHLHACEACRATLAFAGHEPVLSPEATPSRGRPVREPSRRRAWGIALGLSGAAAATAAWLLVVQPSLVARDSGTSGTIGSLAPGTIGVAAFELGVPAAAPGAVTLAEPGSGTPDVAPELEAGRVSAEAGLVLRVPRTLAPTTPADGGRAVVLTLFGGGHEWARRSCRFDELGEAFRIRPARALPAGAYDLRLSVAGREASEPESVWAWRLDVR